MAKKDVDNFIQPLHINRLTGRVLRAPSIRPSAKREILFIYGHHALIERWWPLLDLLRAYGTVTAPDLPGFGGMKSFNSISMQPTIDNYADYLAAFVKMRYNRRRLTIVAVSFGFVVATRMMQRYPEIASKVDLVVSEVGFMHRDDFLFGPMRRKLMSKAARLMATRPMALLIRRLFLNKYFIRWVYMKLPAGRRRFLDMNPAEITHYVDFEVRLWQTNDVRTHWLTTCEFLDLDNCGRQINVPVWHVASEGDHYFDNAIVEQHMRVVFEDYTQSSMRTKAHTPSILANKREIGVMLPKDLRRRLSEK